MIQTLRGRWGQIIYTNIYIHTCINTCILRQQSSTKLKEEGEEG